MDLCRMRRRDNGEMLPRPPDLSAGDNALKSQLACVLDRRDIYCDLDGLL
jgi:hypothetical protein